MRSVNSSEYINEMPKVLRDMVELERGIKYKNYEILLLNDKKIEINKRMDRKMGVILPIMLLIILYGFFAVLYYIYVYILWWLKKLKK